MNEPSHPHPCYADIDWLLSCPDILADHPATWPSEWLQCDEFHFTDATLAELSQRRTGKLGEYFEALVAAMCHASDRFEVLAENLKIEHNRKTLGELDLLLYDNEAQSAVHLELAVKFYLWVPGHNFSPWRWIGAGQRDFLASKVARLFTHQLNLPVIAREHHAWPQPLPFPARSFVWMPGRLFLPADNADWHKISQLTLAEHTRLNPNAFTSSWHCRSNLTSSYTELTKADWLTGTVNEPGKTKLPNQVIVNGNKDPVYLLPDDWPDQASDTIQQKMASS